MEKNPVLALRRAVDDLLEGAAFEYSKGETRKLIARCQRVLRKTAPPVAHEPAVGVFRYDIELNGFVQADETEALDSNGELRPGYQWLFKHPHGLTPH